MSERFIPLTRAQFAQKVKAYPWKRRINAVHMHHTWQPDHSNWRGERSMQGMYEYHTKHNGWSDIAQHVTIAPDGMIWLGRDWNRAPASSSGANGNSRVGPFMFETVGNFDKGHDALTGEQLASVLFVIAAIQEHHKLPVESLKFHRELGSPKTCPGTSIDKDSMLKAVMMRRIAPPFGPEIVDRSFDPKAISHHEPTRPVVKIDGRPSLWRRLWPWSR